MESLEQTEGRAESEARMARNTILDMPELFAAEIAESIGEPTIMLERIIVAAHCNAPDLHSSYQRMKAINVILDRAIRGYANSRAEAARSFAMKGEQ